MESIPVPRMGPMQCWQKPGGHSNVRGKYEGIYIYIQYTYGEYGVNKTDQYAIASYHEQTTVVHRTWGIKKTPPGACRLLVPDIAGSSATTTRASCSPRAIVVRLVQLKKPCHRNVDVVSHPSPQLHLDPGRQGVGGLPSYVYNSQGLS